MSEFKPLLVELGTEELPAKSLPELGKAFFDGIRAGLEARRIPLDKSWDMDMARALYTPRRLAVMLPGVAVQQPSQNIEISGPPVSAALDGKGKPTAALTGFAAKNGVAVDKLERVWTGGIERFVLRRVAPGVSTLSVLPELVGEVIRGLPVPKPMRWGEHDFAFARPMHWLVILLGTHVADGMVLGLKADRMSVGHRFHAPKPIWLNNASDYVDVMREAFVLVDPAERIGRLRADIQAAAKQVGGEARMPDALVEEVNCLVEWPRPIRCSFESEFLRVPQEALMLTMETNQKFFPVLDNKRRLTEHFIAVANIDSTDVAEVRKGFERVIRPRFADAGFFFDEDLKTPLSALLPKLETVSYQQKLGSYADKCARIGELSEKIAHSLGFDENMARRAALLCKADLMTRMVGEFPELQGVMGRHYALASGEPETLAIAIDEAYRPRFAGDAIAETAQGRTLAVADRVDTLVGGFAAGLKPTGNKDPFALRRAALGLGRTLVEGGLDVDLRALLAMAAELLPAGLEAPAIEEIYDFVIERMRGYYADLKVPPDMFAAVLEVRPGSLVDFNRRLVALAEFVRLPDSGALAAANKRLRNILRKATDPVSERIDPDLLTDPAERNLFVALQDAARDNFLPLKERDYVTVLKRLARLRKPIDGFFDGVMVLVDDAAVRNNRLALLGRLSSQFLAVGDVSQLNIIQV
jgi:glycyl-tRNA synthetase beta chain